MISINEERVRDLAHSVRSLRLASDFAEQITPRLRASDEAALRAFLWASAICHSTKGGLRGSLNGTKFKGWDYLLRAFCAAAEDNELFVSPEYISEISGRELLDLLLRYAETPQVTLADVGRRAEILNVCAAQLLEMFQGCVKNLLDRTENSVGGDSGAYAQLASLEAFRDPLKKKSSAFLMTVHFSHLWEIADQENVLPMIDYHRMRVLCRTGCITIHDPNVLQSLVSQTSVPSNVEESIRQAAAEVCKQVVILSRIPMFECDVLIWAHARSCCRHFPLCVSKQLEDNSFYEYIEKNYEGSCEFQEWCPGYRDSIVRNIWEPMIETERY